MPHRSKPATPLLFDLEWRTTALTLVLLPVLIGLGFWQLERAEEKAGIAAVWEQRRLQLPVALDGLEGQAASDLAYLPVSLEGVFDDQQVFLLDNRIYQGRFGYEVLSVLRLTGSEQPVLVNRGWLAGDSSRQSLPQVPLVEGLQQIRGHVYVAPGEPYLLAQQQLEPGWPKRMQAVELPLMKSAPGLGELFPYPVRIDAGQPGALTVDWQLVNVSPEKHTGYAVQWFAMAAALVIIYFLRSSNVWQWLTARRRN